MNLGLTILCCIVQQTSSPFLVEATNSNQFEWIQSPESFNWKCVAVNGISKAGLCEGFTINTGMCMPIVDGYVPTSEAVGTANAWNYMCEISFSSTY